MPLLHLDPRPVVILWQKFYHQLFCNWRFSECQEALSRFQMFLNWRKKFIKKRSFEKFLINRSFFLDFVANREMFRLFALVWSWILWFDYTQQRNMWMPLALAHRINIILSSLDLWPAAFFLASIATVLHGSALQKNLVSSALYTCSGVSSYVSIKRLNSVIDESAMFQSELDFWP